jgi:hypothetical protein
VFEIPQVEFEFLNCFESKEVHRARSQKRIYLNTKASKGNAVDSEFLFSGSAMGGNCFGVPKAGVSVEIFLARYSVCGFRLDQVGDRWDNSG